jgi:hypothetical protein
MTIKTIRIAVLSILFGLTQIGFAQKEIPQKDPFTIRDRNGDPAFVIETLDIAQRCSSIPSILWACSFVHS